MKLNGQPWEPGARMRWRITIRGDHAELRGYIDAPLGDLEQLAETVKPLGLLVASPEDPFYDPFANGSRP